MRIFGKGEDKGELVLVFDIGSSSVGGALFSMTKSGIPKILFSMREPIVLEMDLDADKLFSGTMKALDDVAGNIYKKGLGAPKRIFCTLSSPWHVSQTRVIKLEKNVQFIFNKKLADELTEKEITLFEEEYVSKYAGHTDSVRSFEFKTIKTMLNGYETSTPLNQKIKELEMTVFISISPNKVLERIEEVVGQHFHSKEIKFSSFLVSAFTVVRDIYAHDDSFLLVDIGGEVTDISMIKKNILRESISFPYGCNFITRGVASELQCSFSEARSFTSLFLDGHASDVVGKNLDVVLGKLKLEWLQKFQESLPKLSNDISIPATIYITVEKELADFFCQTIKVEQFNQYTLTDSKFKIIFLSPELLHGMVDFSATDVRDPSVTIDSIYINRFLK